MKDFTVCISSREPASNPWESWKMNCGLLLNTSWFSISCIPRYVMPVVSKADILLYFAVPQMILEWSQDQAKIIFAIKKKNCWVRLGGLTYLFAWWSVDLGFVDWVAHFLEEARRAGICFAKYQNAKVWALASEIDNFIHTSRWPVAV